MIEFPSLGACTEKVLSPKICIHSGMNADKILNVVAVGFAQ